MTITLNDLDFLTSDRGLSLLDRLANDNLSDKNSLSLLTRLRRDYSPEQAGAALEIAVLRQKAVTKFGANAAKLLFTRDALEQASDPLIQQYRAETVSGKVLDVCCGIGADSLAFASARANVTGLDLDPVRIAIARHNAEVLNLSDRAIFEIADVRDGIPGDRDLIFFDPARRDDTGKRIYDVERYIPPLSLIRDWHAPNIMVKLSPGVELAQIEGYGGQVEFISVNGDLKEAILHLRSSNLMNPPLATLITRGEILHWQRESEPESRRLSSPLSWLIEPDPAVIRAGLVEDVAQVFNGYQLDETIAYFTSDMLPVSPWVKAWRVLDWLPFNLKKLRAHLRESGVGRVTVKKRGSPLTPEELIAQLKLKGGSEARTLVLTRYQGDPIIIICEEHPAQQLIN
ncbi:MAG TPA: class I SAM-dependent methyltransferase [Phototrophicaceae bacterium]|jgi:hypothetical protein|nr:class I SAM-dependent methyltransferase [Phototrophicaceae bacterium]